MSQCLKMESRLNKHEMSNIIMWIMLPCITIFTGCISEELVRELNEKKAVLDARVEVANELQNKVKIHIKERDEKAKGYFAEMRVATAELIDEIAKVRLLVASNNVDQIGDGASPYVATKMSNVPKSLSFMLSGQVTLDMIGIPAGTFVMGSPEPEDDLIFDYNVGHKVTLTDSFWIGKYEITQEQYDAVMGTNRYENDFEPGSWDYECREKWLGTRKPVFDLTWEEARNFALRLNQSLANQLPKGYHFDLPTEAQWEYACRAGSVESFNNGKWLLTTTYPSCDGTGKWREVKIAQYGGDFCTDIMWRNDNSSNVAHVVGLKEPNAWGIYDMHGNASEWCIDGWGECETNNVINPIREGAGRMKVARGGDFSSIPRNSTSWARERRDVNDGTGLRLVLTKKMLPAVDREDSRTYGAIMKFQGGEKLDETIRSSYAQMLKDQDVILERFRSARSNAAKCYGDSARYLWKKAEEQHDAADAIRQAAYDLQHSCEKVQSNAQSAERWLKTVKFALDVLGPALDAAANEAIANYERKYGVKTDGNVGSSPSGFATIKGPSSLSYDSTRNNGQWAKYSLYVGGKNVTANTTWSSAGTSITVSSSGRAMAGDPPVGRGKSFKTGIRATFNGKAYTKSITIIKR